jgi:hypothetical protein
MPVFKDSTVGSDLSLWDAEATADRRQWEQAVRKFFEGPCHNLPQEIVTPHIYSKELEDQCSDWFGRSGFVFEKTEDEKRECGNMVPLGNKHCCHFVTFAYRPHSYKELPIYYEIGEVYKPGNQLALYVTLFCEEGDEYADNLSKFIVESFRRGFHPRIVIKDVEIHNGLRKELLYVTKDNTKQPVYVYAVCMTFEWKVQDASII